MTLWTVYCQDPLSKRIPPFLLQGIFPSQISNPGLLHSRQILYCLSHQGSPQRTKDEMVGWHHQLNGHESEQAPGVGDGQGSLVWCSLWGRRVVHNWATELNWIQTHKTSTPSLWMIISHVTNLLTLDTLNPSTRYMNISFWNGLKTEGCSWWIFSSEISVWEAEVLLWVVLSGVLKMSIISGLNSLN